MSDSSLSDTGAIAFFHELSGFSRVRADFDTFASGVVGCAEEVKADSAALDEDDSALDEDDSALDGDNLALDEDDSLSEEDRDEEPSIDDDDDVSDDDSLPVDT